MKTFIRFILCVGMSFSFASAVSAQEWTPYGEEFKTDQAITVSDLISALHKTDEMPVVVRGEISEVCQAEGCWMKLNNEEGEDIFVKFKDHAFLIPKDLASHQAYVSGIAKKKIISVDEQRHYAEDAGKSKEEIEAITEEKTSLRIDATGVLID